MPNSCLIDFSIFLVYKINIPCKELKMYIDPNTGGILFQALAGVFAVLTGVLFFFSRNIRQWIARMRRRGRDDNDDTQP